MAYKDFDGLSLGANNNSDSADGQTLQVNGPTLDLPDTSYINDAAIQREGADLVLDGPHGTITVEGYFSAVESPVLTAPDGTSLTPDLVESFAQSPSQYAQTSSMNDVSPIGEIAEAVGDATITRTDGSVEQITIGTPVYQGDIVETSADGAINIAFTDDSSFAVSEDARMAIDEYVFDPDTEEGAQNFSVLKGVFVFTSGLVGRDDPDDVSIDTPSGSIGIRGTIIAGDVDNSEITVVEGAIVLRDHNGNELTLDEQFETGRFNSGADSAPTNLGQMSAQDVSNRFASVEGVAPSLFSSVNDVAGENADSPAPDAPKGETAEPAKESEAPQEDADANGSVDQNNDNEVDGTVDEVAADANEEGGENAEAANGEGTGETAPTQQTRTEAANNNNGLGSDTTNATEIGTLGGNEALGGEASTGQAAAAAAAANNAPPATSTPPAQIVTDPPPLQAPPVSTETPAPTGTAPFSFNTLSIEDRPSTAPNNFFATTEGHTWSYKFSNEFGDADGDITKFELAPTSETALTAAGITIDSFDETTGELTLTGNAGIANTGINVTITAFDSEGQSSTQTYAFEAKALSVGYDLTVLNTNAEHNGKTLVATTAQNIDIGNPSGTTSGEQQANGHTVFFSDGDDTLNLVGAYGNTLYLGDGNNNVTITTEGINEGNAIFGGDDTDTFTLKNGDNNLFGMGGDDTFVLDLENGTTRADLLSNTNNVIDGGLDGLNGDTLKLLDGGGTPINFGDIDLGYFRGIERIDLTETGNTVIINTISYEDIVQMTDENNTLIFRGDGDYVFFDNLGAVKDEAQDNITYKDGATEFDVYEAEGASGTVTILIEQNGGSDAFTVSGLT